MSNSLAHLSDLESIEKKLREQTGMPENRLIMKTIVDISNEIPQNVNQITPSYAEFLAGRFLHGMDLCGDLIAIAFRYEMHLETNTKREWGTAYNLRAKIKSYKTGNDKKAYADTDEEYIEAKQAYDDAKSFRIMVVNKHKMFEKAHHHMRKIAEQDNDGAAPSSDFSNGNTSESLDDWEVVR